VIGDDDVVVVGEDIIRDVVMKLAVLLINIIEMKRR
jgi:hypothetical protein